MIPRLRLSRRPLHVGGLLLLTAAVGTATAPSALAMVDPTAPTTQRPTQEPAAAPRVLTNSPAAYLGTPEEPVVFGEGKLQVSVAPEPVEDPSDQSSATVVDLAADAVTGMRGATVVVTITGVDLYSDAYWELGEGAEDDTASCTTTDDGSCSLTSDNPNIVEDGALVLADGMSFTVQQTGAPTTGLYSLPPTGDDVFYGAVTGRSVRVAFGPTHDQSDGWDATLRFHDPARTVAGGNPGTAPGAPDPSTGTTAAAAPSDPAPAAGTSGAGTATTATTTGPALAATGADVRPLAAVGGGLLVAGAAGLVLARRRAPR